MGLLFNFLVAFETNQGVTLKEVKNIGRDGQTTEINLLVLLVQAPDDQHCCMLRFCIVITFKRVT